MLISASKPAARKGSSEFFSTVEGKKIDAHLHGPILDNRQADEVAALVTIKTVVSRGWLSFEDALQLYGQSLSEESKRSLDNLKKV